MQRSKVLCVNCSHYRKCSNQTRMYVNYCGGGMKSLKLKIKEACNDCRTNGGLIFKHGIFRRMDDLYRTAQLNNAA